MTVLRVRVGEVGKGVLIFDHQAVPCALGKGGVRPADQKREGDGATPLGIWPLRRVLWRPDRGPRPATELPVEEIKLNSAWCDAPEDPAYNRPVTLPYAASAETLWREDHAYDVIVVLGHNDDPIVAGAGSAIFWHVAQPDWRATEGCVATTPEVLYAALAACGPGSVMEIVVE